MSGHALVLVGTDGRNAFEQKRRGAEFEVALKSIGAHREFRCRSADVEDLSRVRRQISEGLGESGPIHATPRKVHRQDTFDVGLDQRPSERRAGRGVQRDRGKAAGHQSLGQVEQIDRLPWLEGRITSPPVSQRGTWGPCQFAACERRQAGAHRPTGQRIATAQRTSADAGGAGEQHLSEPTRLVHQALDRHGEVGDELSLIDEHRARRRVEHSKRVSLQRRQIGGIGQVEHRLEGALGGYPTSERRLADRPASFDDNDLGRVKQPSNRRLYASP